LPQNRRYWDLTDTGNYIVPSRTSILETLPRVVSNPPRLTPKSTIGAFENVIFQIRNFGTYHPILSIIVLIGAVVVLFTVMKNGSRIKQFGGSNGYIRLDGKEGLLGHAANGGGKAD
jgi:protein disulfide-isomerase